VGDETEATGASVRRHPDGIGEPHAQPLRSWRRHASPLSLAAFGSIVLLAMIGTLGHERDWHARAFGVELDVHAPEVIRNGEFLEMRIGVRSDQPIGELVIGIEEALWRDLTVNTMIPAASEETGTDGEMRFTFAELPAGTPFLFKVDLQVNPDILLGNEGTITVYDGDSELVATSISIAVLP
jgi:hypothetical protein